MTEQLPWTRLVNQRKQLGLTQLDLATGRVTQSLISQIERGRVLPSERILRYLSERLGLHPGQLVEEWSTWRKRTRVRDGLWLAALTSDADAMKGLLDAHMQLLVPFERCVYRALRVAIDEEVFAADQLLSQAWSRETMVASGMSYGRRAPHQSVTDSVMERGFDGAWTKSDRARAMVVEAKVQELLCRQLGKSLAAQHWHSKANARMRDTL
jgi:transcriptional regulator with XRE-family HTH domain